MDASKKEIEFLTHFGLTEDQIKNGDEARVYAAAIIDAFINKQNSKIWSSLKKCVCSLTGTGNTRLPKRGTSEFDELIVLPKSNNKGHTRNYIRAQTVPINIVIKSIKEALGDNLYKDIRYGKKYDYFDGIRAKVTSLRLHTYAAHGVKCTKCGIEGKYFALEKSKENEGYHLNLYAVDENNKELMITADHIFPKSNGGKNVISNTQPMCICCNADKGCEVPIANKLQNIVLG